MAERERVTTLDQWRTWAQQRADDTGRVYVLVDEDQELAVCSLDWICTYPSGVHTILEGFLPSLDSNSAHGT